MFTEKKMYQNVLIILLIKTNFGLKLNFSDLFVNRILFGATSFEQSVITVQIWFHQTKFGSNFSLYSDLYSHKLTLVIQIRSKVFAFIKTLFTDHEQQ